MSEVTQDLKSVLDLAVMEEVVVEREDGSTFQILPVGKKKVKGVPSRDINDSGESDIPLEVILEVVREGREGRDYIKENVWQAR